MNEISVKKPVCPDFFDADFGRKLIKYLGGDPTHIEDDWCWNDFNNQYHNLLIPAFEYFKNATEGNPANAISQLVEYCNLDKEKAFEAIKTIEVGDPAFAIFCLVRCCNLDIEKAFEAIKNIKIGNPAYAIYYLVNYCNLNVNKAFEAIKQIKVGNRSKKLIKSYKFSSL